MRRTPQTSEVAFLVTVLCAGAALAQCPDNDATLPPTPLTYPMTSDQYVVQYQIGSTGSWTNATVYISYYGETNASPYRSDSGYTTGQTSMSFVSIPAQAGALVQLRVTRLSGGGFQTGDHVSVRPSAKPVSAVAQADGSVQLSTLTAGNFDGEQFILWWSRGSDSAGVEGLAFFLNPPYTRPAGSNVKVVRSPADLTGDLSAFDTLDFEGVLAIAGTGNVAYSVPDNIENIFLGPNAWVQGKLRFTVKSATRKIYGPGVLDGSRFNYLNRNCATDDSLYSLSSLGSNGVLQHFALDGIIISDQNHAANDAFYSSTVNNVKIISWNGENAALRLNNSTSASNVFVRSGDDSLMVWGSPVTVTNATVWQNYNGGVVNIGWSNNSSGDGNLIDGLWVVKTDWLKPTAPSWIALSPPGPPDPLASQNNAVFASLMVPSTMYGAMSPPVFRNIFIEDPPQVLFSLKITQSLNCPAQFCTAAFLGQSSSVSLTIQNLYTPPSVVQNSIGFETLPAGYTTQSGDVFPAAYTLTGSMNIALSNVLLISPNGTVTPLTNASAPGVGQVSTNGSNVTVTYSSNSFFVGAVSVGSGTYYLKFPNGNVFGYYNLPSFPIFFHYDLGFESYVDGGNGSAYLYDFASSHWFYTSSTLFPYLYDFTLNNWLYYFPDTKNPGHYTANPRYFSNLATGKIFTM